MNCFRRFLLYAALTAMAFWSTGVLAFTDIGQGRPVTFKDLAGKKFCWNSRGWVLYGANGQFLNDRGHRGTWVVTEPGVVEWRDEVKPGNYRSGRYGQWEVLADGRLYSYRYCLLCGERDRDGWATPCN